MIIFEYICNLLLKKVYTDQKSLTQFYTEIIFVIVFSLLFYVFINYTICPNR